MLDNLVAVHCNINRTSIIIDVKKEAKNECFACPFRISESSDGGSRRSSTFFQSVFDVDLLMKENSNHLQAKDEKKFCRLTRLDAQSVR